MTKYIVQYRKETASLKKLQCGCPVYTDCSDEEYSQYDAEYDSYKKAWNSIKWNAKVSHDNDSVTIRYAQVVITNGDDYECVYSSTITAKAREEFREAILAKALCLLQEAQYELSTKR